MSRLQALIISLLSLLLLVFFTMMFFWQRNAFAEPGDGPLAATPCPIPTPELLMVEPVTSPTMALTQTITVAIGNGDAVTVTAESGTFATTGTFSGFNPAEVTISLLPRTTHNLTVQAHVRPINQGDCLYGNYTLSTNRDKNGDLLVIVQEGGHGTYLPLIVQ